LGIGCFVAHRFNDLGHAEFESIVGDSIGPVNENKKIHFPIAENTEDDTFFEAGVVTAVIVKSQLPYFEESNLL
jgi:TPP-dependent indolepyruvate ferredoxin oxidoreductase alpha subunit